MSNLSDLPVPWPLLLGQGAQIWSGRVRALLDSGHVEVQVPGSASEVSCRVLQTSASDLPLAEDDEVLLWLSGAEAGGGVVLGRVGLHGRLQRVVPAQAFAARPESLVIETQGDLILRNGQARIKLGAAGDIEIDGASFVTRSQRLLRLLAPFIKLN